MQAFLKENIPSSYITFPLTGSGSATPSPVKESVNLNAELEEYTKPKIKKIKLENLSPEDSVKRLRRRERNKIAATKCRNKKKAKTSNLMRVCIYFLYQIPLLKKN